MAKSNLRYGFKKEAEDIALQTRAELELDLTDALDPFKLAEYLGLVVMELTSLSFTCEAAVVTLTTTFRGDFSAALIPNGELIGLLVNDSHTIERQRASVTHECSHHLLGHEPQYHFTEHGLRELDPRIEEEADCLADLLLVPNDAVVSVMRKLDSIDDAAAHFGVSRQLMQKRYNLSGAAKRLNYTRSR